MLSKLTEGAAAAAGSAAATVASAVQSSASSGRPGLPLLPAGADGKPGGTMLASLSWMQQQLAEGLSLRTSNSSGSATSSSSSNAAPAAAGAGPLNRGPAGAAAASSKQSSSNVGSSSSSTVSKPWPKDLPEKLLVRKSLKLQSDPLTAVAAAPDGSALFVAGHNGLLRVLDTSQLSTQRSMKLDNTDLLCISLLQTAGGSGTAAAAAAAAAAGAGAGAGDSVAGGSGSSSRAAWEAGLPLLLAGAQSGRVLAYAATAGRMVGSWAAHEDAVPAILQLSPQHASTPASTTPHGRAGNTTSSSSSSSRSEPPSACRLVTASWDCSVKVWDVAEGRQPWSSTLPLPLLELRDLESGVWALSASASGQLLVTGTEEGVVAAWDLRTRQQIWSTQVSMLSWLDGPFCVCAGL
jgi:WD40 repeat protein